MIFFLQSASETGGEVSILLFMAGLKGDIAWLFRPTEGLIT